MSRIATFALEEANTYTIKGPRAVKSAAVPRRPSGGHRIAPKGVANMSRASCRGAPQPVPNRPFPSLAAVTSSTNKNSIGARADLLPGGARRCVAGVRYTRCRATRRTTRDPSRQHGARLAERPWGLPGLLRRAGVPVPMSAIAGRRRRSTRSCATTLRCCTSTRGRAQSGAVVAVQRASSDLKLNPHLHAVFLDGVYAAGSDGNLEFRALR